MGVNYELAIKADWIAGHLRADQNGDAPLMMWHDQAYQLLMTDQESAEEILNNYKEHIEKDLKKGVGSANEYFNLSTSQS